MNDLYAVTIFPLELLYRYIYLALASLIGSYGLSLLALSLLNYFLLIPLNKLVRGLQESENNIQGVLEPQLKKIKENSQGEERHLRIQSLYQRYSYHPIFAIRNVFPLLVQLPFLMAVYFMVSSLPVLSGISFLFLKDLASPDSILWGYNIMPLVMTFVSLLNACFIVKLSASQKKQAIVVALLFLVLLYNAPSGLLVYWTMNNILILAFGLLAKLSPIMKFTRGLFTMKQELCPSLLKSSGLLLALSLVIPLYFTTGLNLNFFSEDQVSHFFVFSIAATCILLLLGIVIDKLTQISSRYTLVISCPCLISIKKNMGSASSGLCININNIFYLLIAFTVTYFLTALCINIRLYITDFAIINTVRLVLAIALFLFIRKFRYKPLNIGIVSLLIFCCIQFSHNKNINEQRVLSSNKLIQKALGNFPMDEKLNYRPNIYIIYLESYMNSHTLRNKYRIDNTAFEKSLTERGFQIYNDIYAHESFTKGSLLNLFLLNENVAPFLIGNQDLTIEGHDILGGSSDNLLFAYLKKNDYIISAFYYYQSYYFKKREKLLDHAMDKDDRSLHSMFYEIAPSIALKIGYLRSLFNFEPLNRSAVKADIFPDTFKHLEYIQKSSQPSFFLVKPFNALHYNPSSKNLATYDTWISSGEYKNGIKLANKELSMAIDKINEADPDALIILLGDHGHKYLAAAEGNHSLDATPKYFKSEYGQYKMNSADFIDDMFSVFFAIKMPKNAKAKFTIDSQFAYADLFRHIFAALDDNPTFLKHRSDDISINNAGIIIRRDNTIIEEGEIVK